VTWKSKLKCTKSIINALLAFNIHRYIEKDKTQISNINLIFSFTVFFTFDLKIEYIPLYFTMSFYAYELPITFVERLVYCFVCLHGRENRVGSGNIVPQAV
jgi:hypothetical protein